MRLLNHGGMIYDYIKKETRRNEDKKLPIKREDIYIKMSLELRSRPLRDKILQKSEETYTLKRS